MLDALDFRTFATTLGQRVGIDLSDAGPESTLFDDLGFDSLAMAEMLVLFGDASVVWPDELLTEFRTLGDLHHYFNLAFATPAPAVGP